MAYSGAHALATKPVFVRSFDSNGGTCPRTAQCWAKVIDVPGDAPTIQAGIDLASNGDTVEVSPGTYVENINFNGKRITVISSGGPAITTINGGNIAPVVTFTSGETTAAALTGFTLTNGTSTFNTGYNGGGIFINHASPTISGNVITNNGACNGAGMAVESGSPLIQNNTISNNSVVECSGGEGGGISLSGGSPMILSNLIVNNSVRNGSEGGCYRYWESADRERYDYQ